MHWLHTGMGRGRRLAAYAAGELSPADRARMEADLATCPACRQEVEAYRLVSEALRRFPRVALAPEQAAALWPAVERRILQGTIREFQRSRPTLRELFWDHPRLSLASAGAAVVLVLGLTVGQMQIWAPRPSARPNGVEVVSVEAGDDASVMVFQEPGSSLKVIWVFEKPSI